MALLNNRKSYLIDSKFQFKYVRVILMFVIFIILVGSASAYFILWFNLRRSGLLVDDAFKIIEHGLAFGMFFQMAVCIPLILVSGVYLTHRIVGPLRRIEKLLNDIGSGNFGRQLKVRDTDELRELVDWINGMSKKLERLQQEGKIDIRLK